MAFMKMNNNETRNAIAVVASVTGVKLDRQATSEVQNMAAILRV